MNQHDAPILAERYARLADLYGQVQQAHEAVSSVYGLHHAADTHAALALACAALALACAAQADRYRYLSADGLADALDTDAPDAAETVECPVVGVIGLNQCLLTQSAPFSAANPLRVALYRACRGGCPNSLLGEKV